MPLQSRYSLGKPLLGALALALGLARPSTAAASSPFLVVPDPAVAEVSPAFRYANMSDADAFEELDRRKILYSKVNPVAGVRAPIRLTGRLHGVYIHSALPPEERVTSIFEILDARLALALDDFAAVLERHDIDEVVHYTMYRPNVAAPDHEGHGPADSPKAAASSGGARRRATAAPAPAPAPAPAAARHAHHHTDVAAPATSIAPSKTATAKTANAKTTNAKTTNAPLKAAPSPSKAALDGKAALDSKKGGREGIRGSKQKTPVAAPHKPSALPSKATTNTQKPAAPLKSSARSGRRSGPVASVRPAAQAPARRGTWAPPGTRHPAGLAIDVGALHKRDGRWLSVAQHFQGRIGDKTCGDDVAVPAHPDARELRSLVCESYDLGIFTYVLTPNYNEPHADHFHMEIKPGVRWFLYH